MIITGRHGEYHNPSGAKVLADIPQMTPELASTGIPPMTADLP